MDEIEMPIGTPGLPRNARDNQRIRRKLILYLLPKLLETDDIEANFINTGNWLLAQQAVSSFIFDLDYGTTRNTFQTVFFCGAAFLGSKLGNFAGKSLGNLYSSLAGKVSGVLLGTLFGIACGAKLEDFISRTADKFDYDMEIRYCIMCGTSYTHRRHDFGYAYFCRHCRPNPQPLF